MTVSYRLRKASEIMLERGLMRGQLWHSFGKAGPVCLKGAILVAYEGRYNSEAARALAVVDATVVRLGLPHAMRRDGYGLRHNPSIQWSNDWAKDADEVAHILKLAAEDAELQGV